MLRHPRLWIVLAATAIVAIVAGPSVGTLLPILLIAACPLSMLVMAGGMARMGRNRHDDAPTADTDQTARIPADIAKPHQPSTR